MANSRSRVLLEKPKVPQIVKNFPQYTKPKCLSLSSKYPATRPYHEQDQSSPRPLPLPYPISWKSILISSHLSLGLPGVLFISAFPHQDPLCTLPSTCNKPRPSPLPWLDQPNNIWRMQNMQLSWELAASGSRGKGRKYHPSPAAFQIRHNCDAGCTSRRNHVHATVTVLFCKNEARSYMSRNNSHA